MSTIGDFPIDELKDFTQNYGIQLEVYHENKLKERNKVFKLKGGFSAKQSPFAAIYIDKTPVKAFYTEAGECTIDNIIKYLKTIKF